MDILKYVQNCFKLFFFNEKGFNYIEKNIDWKDALIVTFLVSLVGVVGSLIVQIMSLENLGVFNVGEYFLDLIAGFIFAIIFGFIIFGIAHLLYKLVGGNSAFSRFIKFALSVHLTMSILSYPLLLIFALLGFLLTFVGDSIAIMGILMILFIIIGLGMFVWSVAVASKTYAQVYEVSIGKSLLIVLSPYILLIIGWILLILLI